MTFRRDRKTIEADLFGWNQSEEGAAEHKLRMLIGNQAVFLEVLLDIRDLLAPLLSPTVVVASAPVGAAPSAAEDEVLRLRTAIRKHRDQRGDDRCWLDDRELYSTLPEGQGEADLRLPPPEEMLANCKRFVACRGEPGAYVSPQRLVENAEAAAEILKARVFELEAWIREVVEYEYVRIGRLDVARKLLGMPRDEQGEDE